MRRASEIRIVALPEGTVAPEHFGVFEAALPAALPENCVLLRNDCFGVNAGMRSRMGRRGVRSATQAAVTHAYANPLAVGDVPQSDAVAQVLESSAAAFKPGDWVVHTAPWRTRDVVTAGKLRRVNVNSGAPPELYLTALGHTAFTAYTGMVVVGHVGSHDLVYVSAAAGGVGSYAAQIATLLGARVVGSAGSAEKVAYLANDLKLAAAFNYKQTAVADALAGFAAAGLSLYYDNVGGEQLEAAIGAMGDHGRIVLCGMVSGYARPDAPYGPRNLALFITRRLTMTGFTVLDHESARHDFETRMQRWLSRNEIVVRSTGFEGLSALPLAFASVLRGATIGRTLVRTAAGV